MTKEMSFVEALQWLFEKPGRVASNGVDSLITVKDGQLRWGLGNDELVWAPVTEQDMRAKWKPVEQVKEPSNE